MLWFSLNWTPTPNLDFCFFCQFWVYSLIINVHLLFHLYLGTCSICFCVFHLSVRVFSLSVSAPFFVERESVAEWWFWHFCPLLVKSWSNSCILVVWQQHSVLSTDQSAWEQQLLGTLGSVLSTIQWLGSGWVWCGPFFMLWVLNPRIVFSRMFVLSLLCHQMGRLISMFRF